MASMQDFAPGGRFYYGGQHEQIPPWEEQPLVQDRNKYRQSLFWEDQKRRIDDTSWFKNAPWWVQGPMDALKGQFLEGEAATARTGEAIRDVVSGLGESKKEREVRLAAERKKAAAEKQELAQAQRRMPTVVPSIPKIEEEEDFMDGMLKYMLVSHLLGGTAADEYSGTSTVSIGQARDWPTMTPMV